MLNVNVAVVDAPAGTSKSPLYWPYLSPMVVPSSVKTVCWLPPVPAGPLTVTRKDSPAAPGSRFSDANDTS